MEDRKVINVKMLESRIEEYLKKRVKTLGGLCMKFISPGTSGVPDRICVLNGRTVFVEVKRPDGVLSSSQKIVQKRLADLGAEVHTVWSMEDVDEIFPKGA